MKLVRWARENRPEAVTFVSAVLFAAVVATVITVSTDGEGAETRVYDRPAVPVSHFYVDGIECIALQGRAITCDWDTRTEPLPYPEEEPS